MNFKKGRRKTGILGGTFDPVHNGHLAVAELVLNQLRLDRILFIPAARPPHKPQAAITPFSQRSAMLEQALADYPQFELCSIEENRPGPSYSIDTIRQLARQSSKAEAFFFIVGLDAFVEINTWKEWRKLPKLASLVIINRYSPRSVDSAAIIPRLFSGYKEKKKGTWSAEKGNNIYFLAMNPLPVSSTEIREKVRAGKPISRLTPDRVAKYIRTYGFYQDS